MIKTIEHRGMLIREAGIPGETRAEDVVPAHPNGAQASLNRWLMVYATRSFRGVDDDLSILYQVREGGPDGRLIAEGVLAKWVDDWSPLEDGKMYVKQHGHPVVFGVPKGAVVRGKPAPSANVFVVKWRRCARYVDPETGLMTHSRINPEVKDRTQAVEWVQVRLNADETDVEIVQPLRVLRQKGYEAGSTFCSNPSVKFMNQAFAQAVPLNEKGTEWADCNHFDQGRIAALKYVFNSEQGVYEWVETGPFMADSEVEFTEASLVRFGGDWIVAARTSPQKGGIAWTRTADPFAELGPPVFPDNPQSSAPITVYLCPDGVLRLFGGDAAVSPYENGRDPLYCWEVDPDHGFLCTDRRVIFDSVEAELPIHYRTVDMCKLLPHSGGSHQTVVHRVRPRSIRDAAYTGTAVGDEEIACAGIYYARIHYGESFSGVWDFG